MLAVECYYYEGAAAEDVEYIGGESASANVDALNLELQKIGLCKLHWEIWQSRACSLLSSNELKPRYVVLAYA